MKKDKKLETLVIKNNQYDRPHYHTRWKWKSGCDILALQIDLLYTSRGKSITSNFLSIIIDDIDLSRTWD
jgi:hypothetical protein